MGKRPGDVWALDKRVRDFIAFLILLQELSQSHIDVIMAGAWYMSQG